VVGRHVKKGKPEGERNGTGGANQGGWSGRDWEPIQQKQKRKRKSQIQSEKGRASLKTPLVRKRNGVRELEGETMEGIRQAGRQVPLTVVTKGGRLTVRGRGSR